MSFMPADLAAAEREAGWGLGRGAGAAGLAGPEEESGAAADTGAAEAPEGSAVWALAAAGRDVCMRRSSAPSLHKVSTLSAARRAARRLPVGCCAPITVAMVLLQSEDVSNHKSE